VGQFANRVVHFCCELGPSREVGGRMSMEREKVRFISGDTEPPGASGLTAEVRHAARTLAKGRVLTGSARMGRWWTTRSA
jgi:hypothetical protein